MVVSQEATVTKVIIISNDRSEKPLFDFKGDGSGRMHPDEILKMLDDPESMADTLRERGVDVEIKED